MGESAFGRHRSFYYKKCLLAVALCLLLAIGNIMSPYLSNTSSAYAQETPAMGSLEVTVVHGDGSIADPEDFYAGLWDDSPGYFALNDQDQGGILLGAFPTCNYSESQCEVDVSAGNYSAGITLGGDYLLLGSAQREFENVFTVSEGTVTTVNIVANYGYVEINVLKNDGDGVGVVEDNLAEAYAFTSGYSYASGYYSIFDGEGDFAIDAVSCNVDSSTCRLPLTEGIYEARILVKRTTSSIDNEYTFLVFSLPFEIVDSDTTKGNIFLDSASTGTSTDSDNGGSNNNNNNNNNNGSHNPPQQQPNQGAGGSTGGTLAPIILTGEQVSIDKTSISHFIDKDGMYHLIGELYNGGGYSAKDISITGVFYGNSSRDFLSIRHGYSFLPTLNPGQKVPFEIVVKDAGIGAKIANHSITVISTPTRDQKPVYLGSNVTDEYIDQQGNYHVEGRVYNYASVETHFAKVVTLFHDKNGTLVYLSSKYVTSRFAALSAFDFEHVISIPPSVNSSKINSVSTIIESDEFSMVREGHLKSPITIQLDSDSYDNGMQIEFFGTLGRPVDDEHKYAVVYVVWPDGYHFDRETVPISTVDGSFRDKLTFYAGEEFRDKVFTFKILHEGKFAETTFSFNSPPSVARQSEDSS